MNKDIYRLFECLTTDLQLPVRNPRGLSFSALGELKASLLLVLESEKQSRQFSESLKWSFLRKLNEYFVVTPRYTRLWDPEVVKDLYQILCFALKVKIPHTKEQGINYVTRFKQNEASCRAFHIAHASELHRMARACLRTAAQSWDISAASIAGVCRHGPGAVAEGETGSDKNYWVLPPRQLTKTIPYETFFANVSMLAELPLVDYSVGDYESRQLDRVVSRLALVPKDHKGPRGVFISPKEAVFCQLGIEHRLREGVASSWLRYCFDPTSQVPSQELALESSSDRRFATLDLSDASDRISVTLAKWLFHPGDFQMLWATRPSAVLLPGSDTPSKLQMLAPMGDGKTFPVLTIVVASICVAAMLLQDGYVAARAPDRGALEEYVRKSGLRVFGDDIIVKTEYYSAVCDALQHCNLKVNIAKSFAVGFFRESCGMDAYKGVPITPYRLRVVPTPDTTLKDIHVLVELHNRMAHRDGNRLATTVSGLRAVIEASGYCLGYTSRPDVVPTAVFCRQSVARALSRVRITSGRKPWSKTVRWNEDLQTSEQRIHLPVLVQQCMSSLNPWWDLNYWLLSRGAAREDEATQYATNRRVIVGSPIAEEQWETVCRAMNLRVSRGKHHEYRDAWVPLL